MPEMEKQKIHGREVTGAAAVKFARDRAKAVEFMERVYVCNVSEEEFVRMYDFGVVRVAGCQGGEEYVVTPVEWGLTKMVSSEGEQPREISALEIARAVVKQCNDDIGEHSYAGVFLIEKGDKPTEKELGEAHKKLKRRYEHCVNIARGEWERTRRTDWISDEQRRAARYLNLNQQNDPWISAAQMQELCAGCGIAHMPGIAKCGHCGAILNFEKAKELGLLPAHMMQAEHGRDNTAGAGAAAGSRQSPAAGRSKKPDSHT